MAAVSSTKYNRHSKAAWLIHNQQTQIVFMPKESFSRKKKKKKLRASTNLSFYPHFIFPFLFISPYSWCSCPLNLFTWTILCSFLFLRSHVSLSVSPSLSSTVFCVNSLPSFFFPFFFAVGEPLGAHLQSCLSFHGFWKWMFYCLH